MTRIQLVIVLAIAVIIVAIAGPKAVKISRIARAEHNVLTIASGCARYRTDTGHECTSMDDLLKDPGVPGWMGPYVKKKTTRTPWGGSYKVELKEMKVGIPKGDEAPDKHEFGGEEEISFSFAEDMNLE